MSRFSGPPMVSRPGKVDCSKLGLALAKLALNVGTDPNVKTLSDVTAILKKEFPELEHADVVNAIVDSTTGAPKKPDATRAKVNALKREARSEKARSEPALKAKLESQIADLEGKLADPAPEVPQLRHVEGPMSKELARLEYRRDLLRRQINQRVRDLKPKGFWGTVAEPANLARTAITSIDLSAVLRQGGFVALGNPVRAAKSIVPMLRSFASAEAAYKINKQIQDRPNAPLYDRSDLYLAPENGTLHAKEEAFMSRLAGKIPGLAGSQRAYNTFLNKLRADSFDAMAAHLAKNGEPTLAESRAIANYINVATGRAPLGKLESAAVPLATVFFSPRYVASRFQLLAGQPLYGGTARTRKLIATEYAKYLTGMATVYALGKLAGGEIESDPRSSDFGKIRLGETRLDPLSGLSQVSVLMSRLATGETKRLSGKVVPIRGKDVPFGGSDSADVIANFLRSKLAPVPGAVLNLAAGENVVGEPVGPLETARDLTIPLSFRDILEVMEAHGIPEGTAIGILGLFGMGIQHHKPRENRKPGVEMMPVPGR